MVRNITRTTLACLTLTRTVGYIQAGGQKGCDAQNGSHESSQGTSRTPSTTRYSTVDWKEGFKKKQVGVSDTNVHWEFVLLVGYTPG